MQSRPLNKHRFSHVLRHFRQFSRKNQEQVDDSAVIGDRTCGKIGPLSRNGLDQIPLSKLESSNNSGTSTIHITSSITIAESDPRKTAWNITPPRQITRLILAISTGPPYSEHSDAQSRRIRRSADVRLLRPDRSPFQRRKVLSIDDSTTLIR
jgi:hypothetical protein